MVKYEIQVNDKILKIEYDSTGEAIYAFDLAGKEEDVTLTDLSVVHAYMFYKMATTIYGIKLEESELLEMTANLYAELRAGLSDLQNSNLVSRLKSRKPYQHRTTNPLTEEEKEENREEARKYVPTTFEIFPEDWQSWDDDTFNKFMNYWLSRDDE